MVTNQLPAGNTANEDGQFIVVSNYFVGPLQDIVIS